MKRLLAVCVASAVIVVAPNSLATSIVPPCGEQLSDQAVYLGIAALSNDQYQGNPSSCHGDVRGRFGLEYQCVEYIRRFYGMLGADLGGQESQWARTNAHDFFKKEKVKQLGLVRYKNGNREKPVEGDIVVFKKEGEDSGHVAVVKGAGGSSFIILIEENLSPTGIKKLALTRDADGKWFLADRGNLKTLGWLRLPVVCPENQVAMPEPCAGHEAAVSQLIDGRDQDCDGKDEGCAGHLYTKGVIVRLDTRYGRNGTRATYALLNVEGRGRVQYVFWDKNSHAIFWKMAHNADGSVASYAKGAYSEVAVGSYIEFYTMHLAVDDPWHWLETVFYAN